MLGEAQTNIKAVITAEDKASHVLKGFGDNVGSFGSTVEKGLKAAAVGLAAAGAAAVGFGTLAVKAFSESEDLIAQTNAVLKSTGGIAGVTADQVTKLATSLEKQTKFSDESVRSVENLLLTFTAIGKDIFPQATTTVLDMATALGEDTKSASIQLGKALQDPILGVTALRRVGVNFNQSQQDVIKNLVETGRSAEAQQLILKELNREFGGSAVAAGGTFSGSLAKLKNQLNNVEESVGGVIVNALTPFINKLSDVVAKIDWTKVVNKTIDVLKEFWHIISDVGGRALNVLKQAWDFLAPSVEALVKTFTDKVVPVLQRLWKEVIEPLAPVIGTVFVGALWLAINALNVILTVVTPVINFLLDHKQVVIDFAVAFGALALAMKFDSIAGAFVGNINVILGALSGARAAVSGFFSLVAGGTVMGGIVTAGALADIALVAQAVQTVLGAINAMNDAKRQIAANDAANQAAIPGLEAAAAAGKTAAQRTSARNTLHMLGVQGYAQGGFTGAGMPDEIAGVVHRGEYVVPKNQVDQNTGLPKGGRGGMVNVVVNVGLYAGSEQEKRKVAMELLKSLQDIASARSSTVAQMLGA